MSVSLSQLNQSPYLVAPAQPASFVLLGLYVVIIGLMAYRRRDELGMWGPGRWVATLFLFVLAPIFSTSLAIELSGVDLPAPTIVPVEPAAPAIAVPAFVPVVLAAGWLGVIPTLVVGAAGGITRAAFGTNRLFTFFEWMLAAGLLAIFIRQNYRGRLMGMLRHPLGAATASAVFVSIAAFVSFLVDGSGAGLSGLEAIGVQWQGNGLPLVVELLVAGVVGEAARLGLARWWVHPDIQRPPPYAVSLNNRILYTLVPVIGAGIVILTIASQNIAASVATNIVVDQMERDAQNAASGIPFFVRTGESLIRDLARDERLQTMDVEARNRQLATGIRTVPYFDQLVYFDVLAAPAAAYPQLDVTGLGLTRAELEAVELALEGVLRSVTVYPQGDENVVQIAYIAPVEDAGSGAVVGALLGRTNLEANPLMEPVINNLQGLLVGSGAGFITDENNRIIYHPDPYRLGDVWLPLEADDVLDTDVEDGRAYRDRTATGAPQLVYYLPAAGHPWQVVIIVPNEAVGLQAAQITVPLFLILVGIAVVGLVALFFASARITHPLKKLTDATSAFARGEMDVPVAVSGDDEVGQLGAAYERMRLRLRARLEELRMLLGVSQTVAGSLDLEHSIPPILEAAQYVVDASGVRLVLKAGSEPGEPPKTFVRGTAAPTMAALDEDLLSLVETEGRLAIDNLARAKAVLEVSRVLPEVQSLIALPLRHKASFLGTLWLGYEYPRRFVNNEQSFLETLASQAAVAIANAHLYEASEGGRQRLQAILSSTPDAVIVTDERNRLLLINPAAQSIFEIDGAAQYGKRIDKVFRRRDVIALLGDDEESSQPHELSLPDGRTLYATAFRLRLDDGSDIGRVAVMRDVTHFKELDQLKTEFVATVSHDLRAPLTLMRGYATMMPMVGPLNARQEEFAQKIMLGIEQMTELIDELLDLNRIEAGVGVAHEPCDIHTIVQEATVNLRTLAERKKVALQVNIDTNLPKISGDSTLLRQALSNLVDNAVKYTDEGGSVQVVGSVQGTNILLTVRDSGIGISQPDQVRMFEKFYRVRHEKALYVKGSGLGLSIVRSIVERHGGRVWVESQLGQGSTFFISIPIYSEAAPQPA